MRISPGVKRLLTSMMVTFAAAFVIGFFLFVRAVNIPEEAPVQAADGIVALTGGTSRVADAVKLLAKGYGKRLLVTGVNPATSRHDLAKMMGDQSYIVECCVDLDYEAVNTIGNAIETRKWARENGFTSLLIVTSNYHMPRTLIELQNELKREVLIPMPISSVHAPLGDWWRSAPTFKLLFSEYVKYLAAIIRHKVT